MSIIALGSSDLEKAAKEWAAKFRALADDLRQSTVIEMDLPFTEALKVTYFENGSSRQHRPPRPFAVVSGLAEIEAIKAVQNHVFSSISRNQTFDLDGAFQEAGEVLQGVFVTRLSNQGGDLPYAPVSSRTQQHKNALGQGSRTGIATGATRSAIQRAAVKVTRR